MAIRYDDALRSGDSIHGTSVFSWVGKNERSKNRIDRKHAHDAASGSGNGKSVMMMITIDPIGGRFTLGESEFTTSAVAWGIHMGTFIEGTEWMSPTGRVRIIRGKLRYTSGQKLYPLPELREDMLA